MPLTVLSVAYPFAPVGVDAVGGAEQVVAQLDRALVAAGHRSLVLACHGSRVQGRLIPLSAAPERLDDAARAAVHARVRSTLQWALRRWPVDVVHLHGIDFLEYLPPPGPPVLATLHLPPAWYPSAVFGLRRPDTWLVCVSNSQRAACPPSSLPLLTIPNGVDVNAFADAGRKRDFVVALGRVCPEKGFHLALDAARQAGARQLLGGRVFGYAEHQRYYREQILPRLDHRRRFIGPVGLAAKRRLLAAARCLLVPSLAAETSSLVAMEAGASGTPVVAFRAGALAEIVEPGVTGFLVDSVAEMAEAIGRCDGLSAEVCRERARVRFSAARTEATYLDVYRRLTDGRLAAVAGERVA